MGAEIKKQCNVLNGAAISDIYCIQLWVIN